MEHPNTHTTSNYNYSTHQNSQHIQQPRARPPSRSSTQFISRLILSLLLLFLTITTIFFIAWLVIHPHQPIFHVDSLVVSNFSLSSSSSSSSNSQHLTSSINYDLKITIKNPNKKLNLSFEAIEASISYKKISLSKAYSIKSFELGNMAKTMVNVNLRSESDMLLDKRTGMELSKKCVELSEKRVGFDVKITVGVVKYKFKYWPSKHGSMNVLCKNLNVEFKTQNMTGTLVGDAKRDCSVLFI